MSKELLIADDDPVVRHLLGAMLQSAGYRVVSTESGAETIALLRERADTANLPALVFLDLQLIDMAGAEVLTEIRAMTADRHLPVVMLSANSKEEILRDHPAASEADGFLEKPFPPTAVTAVLDALLS